MITKVFFVASEIATQSDLNKKTFLPDRTAILDNCPWTPQKSLRTPFDQWKKEEGWLKNQSA